MQTDDQEQGHGCLFTKRHQDYWDAKQNCVWKRACEAVHCAVSKISS